MKKTTVQIILISIISLGIISFIAYNKSTNKIKLENSESDQSLLQAKNYIENNNYERADKKLDILLEKYPKPYNLKETQELSLFVKNKIKEIELIKKEALPDLLKNMHIKYDDMRDINWYSDKSTPQYTNYNSFHLYITKSGDKKPFLRFRIQYTDDKWLFIENYIIKTDNNTYNISTNYGNINKDHGSRKVWEWYDVSMNNNIYNIINHVINSKSAKIRYNGKQYYKDRIITNKEKQALKNVLDVYEAMGGKSEF